MNMEDSNTNSMNKMFKHTNPTGAVRQIRKLIIKTCDASVINFMATFMKERCNKKGDKVASLFIPFQNNTIEKILDWIAFQLLLQYIF